MATAPKAGMIAVYCWLFGPVIWDTVNLIGTRQSIKKDIVDEESRWAFGQILPVLTVSAFVPRPFETMPCIALAGFTAALLASDFDLYDNMSPGVNMFELWISGVGLVFIFFVQYRILQHLLPSRPLHSGGSRRTTYYYLGDAAAAYLLQCAKSKSDTPQSLRLCRYHAIFFFASAVFRLLFLPAITMRDLRPVSQYTSNPNERSNQSSVLYSSVSSVHSHDAEATSNDDGQVPNDTVESGHGQNRYGPVQNRPDDLDSLQEIPFDWEEQEDATQNQSNEPPGSLGRLPKSWQPLWLRRHILITRNQGLGSTSSTDGIVYLWKYLPTTGELGSPVHIAHVNVLMAVWHGIDFSTRLLQPWANLQSGPKTADSTLLLDLLTPILPVMVWTASKVKAWPSLLAITAVIVEFYLPAYSRFDASGWDPNTNDNVSSTVYYGVWAQKLPWPDWTFENATLEPLLAPETDGTRRAKSYTGTTRGFFPALECDEARIDGDPRMTSQYTYTANITFNAPSCSAELNLPLLDSTQVALWKGIGKPPERSFVGTSQFVTCPDQTQRYFAAITLVDSSMKLLRSSSLFCRPSYSVQNVTVQVALPENKARVEWDTLAPEPAQMEGLDPMDLMSYLVNSTRLANLPLVKQPNKTAVNNDPFIRAASASLLRGDLDTIYLESFLDSKVLADHLRNAFSGMASIAVHTSMLGTTQALSLGTSVHDEARVRVPAGAALPICGLLLLCALLSLLLLALRPRDVVPRDPRGIGGIGVILRNSHELQRRCGSSLPLLQRSMQYAQLSSYTSSEAQPKFLVNIEDHVGGKEHKGPIKDPDKSQEMWQPIVFTIWCRPLAVALPLLLIAALEYIQRTSDTSNGFVVIPKAISAHYAATIIPAVIMWALGALFSSMHFNTLLLSPYHAMKSIDGATARRSTLSHNLGRLPLVSLFASLRDRHHAACFSALATILGAFLTIVVAGLYSFASVNVEKSITVRRTDGFNVSWYGLEDDGAGQALSLIVWQNLSYPRGTYDDLVFPNLALNETDTSAAEDTGRIAVSVPARRAVLECDVQKPEEVKVEIRNRCPGSTGKPIRTSISSTIANVTGFGGQLGNVWETASIITGGPLYTSNHPPPKNSPGCHSLIFYYGSFPSEIPQSRTSRNLSSSEAQVTTLASSRWGSSLGIDPSRPPVPDEETARFVNAGTPDASNVQQYQVAFPLTNGFRPVTSNDAVLRDLRTLRGLDGFFQAVVLADGGLDPASLVGGENAPRLVEAMSKMYGRYMAQAMHRVMRSSDAMPPPSQRTLPAVAAQAQTRLRQNAGPKVALQVLLGLMSVCAVAGWLAMRDTKFLPHEPGSIAGVAALVAGSGLWGDAGIERGRRAGPLVPDGAEWMDDEDLVKAGRWDDEEDGVLFGFGPRADGSVGVHVLHRRYTVEMEGQGQGSPDDQSYEMVHNG
ncbi:uncharacterized protein PG986_005043 [Apiospora aurea]|uniref:Uncharacterized protein n=1 Tax=Apiospora aurea TaxID=335848 RepID=A0ABR1QGF2_9PEZI